MKQKWLCEKDEKIYVKNDEKKIDRVKYNKMLEN